MGNLTAVGVKALKTAGVYGDGQGLYLQVTSAGARSWIFRYQRLGRRREMGLGSLDDTSLAEARRKAQDARKLIDDEKDPIDAREAVRAAEALARANAVTFREAAKSYVETHKRKWTNAQYCGTWSDSLERHVFPHIGNKAVGDITVADVRAVLTPIWLKITPTAAKVRGRIETVINFARADDETRWANPAQWERHRHALLALGDVHEVEHHPAMAYADVPAFMRQLAGLNRGNGSVSSMALSFTILTWARTGETIGARWQEIDMGKALWTVPKVRMKARRPHVVPLSPQALAIIERMSKVRLSAFVFPGRPDMPLSDGALLECLRRLRPGLTVHGFRSAARTWAGEETDCPYDIAEVALAHKRKDSKTVDAYMRGPLLKKRRELMEAWGEFCGP